MKTVAIIQARMGSTRLPGKVLMDIAGETMLARVIHRTRLANSINAIVVATTTVPSDDAIVRECERLGVDFSRGSEDDVLDRYYHTARQVKADTICRITSDCPLIDPTIIDQVIEAHWNSGAEYTSNSLMRTFPRGLDVEVFGWRSLETVWREAREPYQRAHVTPFFYQNPARFRLQNVGTDEDLSRYRWTVDTPRDLEVVRRIYADMPELPSCSWEDVLNLVRSNPERYELNACVPQKRLEEG